MTTPAEPGKNPDKISVGGVELVVGRDISVSDASDANVLAEKLAEKLNADGNYENGKFTVTADNGNLIFTAKTGGEVGGTTADVPADRPADLSANIASTSSNTNKGALTFGNVTETAKGSDATQAYSTYDLSGLKEGDIVTVDGYKFEVGADGLIETTTNGSNGTGTKSFAQALADLAGNGVTAADVSISADKALTIKAHNAGVNNVAPKPTIRVETKETTDATDQLETPASKDAITGTWNVQSTINQEGGAANAGPLASTAFNLTADMVKDGNTLTIGKDTYVFKVGAESTVEARTARS